MIYIDDILTVKDPSPDDVTFDYESSGTYSVTTNGYKDFFDVHADIENDVTCELLASDCQNPLTGND